MKKLIALALGGVLLLGVGAAFAASPDPNEEPGYQQHEWLSMWATISGASTFVVNIYDDSNNLIGDANAAGHSGTYTQFGFVASTANLNMKADDAIGNTLTHLGVSISSNLPNWVIDFATDNEAFTGGVSDRGGLVLDGATSGEDNRIQTLWQAFTAHSPATLFTGVDTNWHYFKDLNDTDYATSRDAGYTQLAWGWNGGGQVQTAGGFVAIVGTEFYVNIAGICSGENAGAYHGYPNLILRAR